MSSDADVDPSEYEGLEDADVTMRVNDHGLHIADDEATGVSSQGQTPTEASRTSRRQSRPTEKPRRTIPATTGSNALPSEPDTRFGDASARCPSLLALGRRNRPRFDLAVVGEPLRETAS